MTTDPRQRNNLDFLRVLLAVLVIISHAYDLRGGDYVHREPLRALTGQYALSLGAVGVNGFFVISGYLIAGSYLRSRGLRDYLGKRVLRIYPGFLVAFFVSITLLPLMLGERMFVGHDLASVITRAAVLGDPGPVPGSPLPLNGSLWTIQPEFICYLLLGFFGVTGALRSRSLMLAMTLGALAVFATTQFQPGFAHTILGTTSMRLTEAPRLVTYFLFGTSIYVWRDRIPSGVATTVVAVLVALASLLHHGASFILFPPAFATAVMGLGLRSTPGVRSISAHGDFSYGLYLYAFPIEVYLRHKQVQMPVPLDAMLVTAMTLPCAVFSWFCVERVALKWKVRHVASTSRHQADVVDLATLRS